MAKFVEQNLHTDASWEVAETLSYWRSLCSDDGRLPRWRDFDWMMIPIHIISCCGVVDVVGGEVEFLYRFWGTRHVAMHDQEMTRRSIHDMRPTSVRDTVLAQYRIVRDCGEPRLFVATYRSKLTSIVAREFSLRLPFSDDGESISHIFALSDISDDFEQARRVCQDF